MDRKDARRFQLSQLALLKRFDEITKKLDLDYYLVFGTLLGAVRHKGFIPWDPDIDVAMHRDQYEKLREYFTEQPEEDLFYEHYTNEPNHISPHAILKIKGTKIVYNIERSSRYPLQHDGIFIDIFPIDPVDEDKKKQQKQVARISKLKRLVVLKAAPTYGEKTSTLKRIGKTVVSLALSPVSLFKLNKDADDTMKLYDDQKNSRSVAILTDPHVFEKQLFPRECFMTPKRLMFEDAEFSCPSDPDMFLTIRYGDYMKLPPEDQRWGYLENAIKSVDYGENTFVSEE